MFGTSRALLLAAAGLLVGALAVPAGLSAQEPTTVTGCLSKGAGEGTFSIKADDGKTYTLASTDVALDAHVGHTVMVTGTPSGVETGAVSDTGMARDTGMAGDTGMAHHPGMAHDTAGAKETGMNKEPAAAGGGTFTVTSLKMVSGQCN